MHTIAAFCEASLEHFIPDSNEGLFLLLRVSELRPNSATENVAEPGVRVLPGLITQLISQENEAAERNLARLMHKVLSTSCMCRVVR